MKLKKVNHTNYWKSKRKMNKKFIFKKDFLLSKVFGEKIPRLTTVTILGERIFMNDIPIIPQFRNIVTNIVENDKLRKEYLQETVIPYNQI